MLRNICWVFSGEHGLSKERCDFLVKRGLEAQEQVATHQNENQTYSSDDKVRASRISWLHGEDIYECVRPFVNKAKSPTSNSLFERIVLKISSFKLCGFLSSISNRTGCTPGYIATRRLVET